MLLVRRCRHATSLCADMYFYVKHLISCAGILVAHQRHRTPLSDCRARNVSVGQCGS